MKIERGTRKYTFALISLGALSIGMIITGFFPVLPYPTYSASVIALFVAFVGGNVAAKLVAPPVGVASPDELRCLEVAADEIRTRTNPPLKRTPLPVGLQRH